MRIIAGEARGRRLQAPKGHMTRPTADRVRESIFNVLGQRLSGEKVLDLFAGSGAMGLEALSRGAATALFVDRDPEAILACRTNLRSLGWLERGEVLRSEALRAIGELERAGSSFDLVFVDPPYDPGPESFLEALGGSGILRRGATVVAEHDARWVAGESFGILRREDRRSFGGTGISYFRAVHEETR